MYLFILACIISYLLYFKLSEHYQEQKLDPYSNMSKDKLYDKVLEIKDSLHNVQLREQKCQIELNSLKNNIKQSGGECDSTTNVQDKFLSKIYNPLSSPSPLYPGGSFSTRPYDGYRQFQMIGYLTGPTGQFPVMGRYKFSGNTNKYEYQCINEGRNSVKIQFKNKNDNELYDGDSVTVPELGGELTFKKYEDTDGNRYDPTVI